MSNHTQIKKRIAKEAMLIRVQTTLGTSVTISKKDAYILLDTLERREVLPSVEFTEVRQGRYLVTIDAPQKAA